MSVLGKAIVGLVQLVVVLGLALFLPAWTLRWTEAWVCLAVFTACAVAVTAYLARRDPALLARRTQAGPVAEAQASQKVIQAIASLAFLALFVVPALDRRFDRLAWSRAPLPVVVAGDVLLAVGFGVVFLVFRENTFTSATIEVAADQRVVDTGPYAVVRHPMYAGALVLVAGIPLALGSLVSLALVVPFVGVLAWRLLDEERYLVASLPGYAAYRAKIRWRLVPGVW